MSMLAPVQMPREGHFKNSDGMPAAGKLRSCKMLRQRKHTGFEAPIPAPRVARWRAAILGVCSAYFGLPSQVVNDKGRYHSFTCFSQRGRWTFNSLEVTVFSCGLGGMIKEKRAIKTCYVSAPAGVSLDVLRESLLSHDIRPLIPEELSVGTDLASETQRQLAQADLVIGVLPRGKQSPWVLFELGQAFALGRRILLIASPKSESIPFALQRLLVLRIEPNNRSAIDFALDQLLSAPPESPPEQNRKPFHPSALGQQADSFIARFDHGLQPGSERELLKLLTDALQSSGVDAVVEHSAQEQGVDVAVWSDVLEPFVGNPLLIEIKRSIRDKETAAAAFAQVSLYLGESGSRWALLLYAEGPPPDDRLWSKCPPNILIMPVRSLLEGLRTQSFPEIVRDMRNRRVHSVRP